LRSLYAVRIGSFKTSVLSVDGREQVTGFQMPGETLGLDAISSELHSCNAFALEDSEVCPIPFAHLERLGRELPSLQHNLNKILSREIVRDHDMLMMLGNMNADERLAAFLLNLSQRLNLRGYSSSDFVLKMRREEIGSYLACRSEVAANLVHHLRRQLGRGCIFVDAPRLEAFPFVAAKLGNKHRDSQQRRYGQYGQPPKNNAVLKTIPTQPTQHDGSEVATKNRRN